MSHRRNGQGNKLQRQRKGLGKYIGKEGLSGCVLGREGETDREDRDCSELLNPVLQPERLQWVRELEGFSHLECLIVVFWEEALFFLKDCDYMNRKEALGCRQQNQGE